MTAADRVLALLERPPQQPDTARGYLDLLGESAGPHATAAQRLMRSSVLPRIYEELWRPLVFGLAKGGPFGPGTAEEYRLARERLGLRRIPDGTVLDVACGPGNLTRSLAAGMTGHGLVVGIDASATMLDRAVAESGGRSSRGRNGAADIGYVRGDAADLPFRDDVFDAVCCSGALYLFDDPWAAMSGMARVLRPGGAIVVLTSRRPAMPLAGLAGGVIGRFTGVRMFGPDEVTAALADRGFTEIDQRSYGLMQMVGGTLA